jgi:hypothetical protein
MSKTIQQKLREAAILDKNEPILSFVRVFDYLKHQQLFQKILKEEIASLFPANKTYYLLVSSKYLLKLCSYSLNLTNPTCICS